MSIKRYKNQVEVGQEIKVIIETIGTKGDGITKLDGFVIFIPNAEVNKTYNIKITSVKSKFAFGEIIGVI